ncbi:hypothetical protein [Catenisphaera adipataccumulans]|jgi:hypothetical protein|uniref:NADH:ubiquinone oxidoreductase subunit F (NADH-binding) n=1 Tax=Catenisphaera adipataccumulans TaxID=700500 RepID=A0A7W8CXZ9_9FIRM|nr:hypothetical protein [Catenisphaera adipataccumulans]MBB5182523.1 NADH:ubiquinone oxidoreductase subunit F (NADH-binding) [Catenisphaera adipataccumulans]
MMYKYYIDVVTLVGKEGQLQPLFVRWQEKTYKIDQVLAKQEKFSPAGGCGVCYKCRFGSQIRNLYWEKDRWFLESEVKVSDI